MTTTMAEQEYELGRLMIMVERMQQAGVGERRIAAAVAETRRRASRASRLRAALRRHERP